MYRPWSDEEEPLRSTKVLPVPSEIMAVAPSMFDPMRSYACWPYPPPPPRTLLGVQSEALPVVTTELMTAVPDTTFSKSMVVGEAEAAAMASDLRSVSLRGSGGIIQYVRLGVQPHGECDTRQRDCSRHENNRDIVLAMRQSAHSGDIARIRSHI